MTEACNQWIISMLHVLWTSVVSNAIKSVKTCKTSSQCVSVCVWKHVYAQGVCMYALNLTTQYPHCCLLLFEQQMEPTAVVWIQFSTPSRCHCVSISLLCTFDIIIKTLFSLIVIILNIREKNVSSVLEYYHPLWT